MSWLQAMPLFGDLFKLISEAIPDPDKRTEASVRLAELHANVTATIVGTRTVPWIDGVVKLVYALVALATPLGAAAAMAFNFYCKYKGIPLDMATEATTLGGFPAWAAWRRREKATGTDTPASIRRSGPPR